MNNDSKTIGQAQPQVPVVPAQPVQGSAGSLNKEAEPVRASASLSELSPAGIEVRHGIDQELAELGVKETADNPDLTPEHKQAGLDHSVPSSQTAPTGFKVPLTEEEARAETKRKKPTDSGWGFAALVLKVLKAAGLAGS